MIKTNYLYNLRTDNITDENGQNTSVYGITVLKIEDSIPNIFISKAEAENFVSLCNKKKLEPIHLHCVVEDLFA